MSYKFKEKYFSYLSLNLEILLAKLDINKHNYKTKFKYKE